MKRIFLTAGLCMVLAAALWAEKPRRVFEWGLDLDAGFANSAFTFSDIFNDEKTINFNLNEFGKRSFDIAASLKTQTFFTLNIAKEVKGETKKFKGEKVDGKREVREIQGEKDNIWSFQFYTGADAAFFGSLSKEITEFFSKGNAGNDKFQGTGGLGMSVFANVGLRGSRKFDRWTISADPAVYVPLLYSASPDVRVTLDTSSGVKGGLFVDADLYYSIFALDTMVDGDIEKPDGYSSSTDLPMGFDLSGSVEYEFLPFLDLGGSISHLPIVPALMHNRARMQMKYDFEVDDLLGQLQDGGANLDNLMEQKTSYGLDASERLVFRPLRFDIYARYKPVLPMKWMKVTVTPNMGLSFLTIYGNMPCFNLGVEGRLDLLRLFTLKLSSSLRENIWQQKAVIEFNLRLLELDIGISSQSQDFVGSILGKGIGATVGLRMGW